MAGAATEISPAFARAMAAEPARRLRSGGGTLKGGLASVSG